MRHLDRLADLRCCASRSARRSPAGRLRLDVGGLDHDDGRGGPAGERRHDVVVALHDRACWTAVSCSTLRVSVCRPMAGEAMASRNPADSAAESPGRASTRSRTTFQSRLPPMAGASGRGTAPGPIRPGRRAATTARAARSPTRPWRSAPPRWSAIAKPANSCMPDRNMPAIATMTVSPEISTDRPEVAAAIAQRRSGSRPRPAPRVHGAGRTGSSRRPPPVPSAASPSWPRCPRASRG